MSELEKRKKTVYSKLSQLGQEHIFQFWPQLSSTEKEMLLRQTEDLDASFLRKLDKISFDAKSEKLSLNDLKPFPVITLAKVEKEQERYQEALSAGGQLMRAGKVGIIMVAGGQGSRIGHTGPKGTIAVGPITSRSLFQYHFEKIIALERRYEVILPFFIMTSQENHQQTQEYLQRQRYFGKDPASVFLFSQGMLPVVDENKKVLLENRYTLSLAPDGHGGILNAIKRHNLTTDMVERGLEYLFYFQVDNVLLRICDAAFLGFHAQLQAEMSAKTVYKTHPDEKLGVIALLGEKPVVIEYTEMPNNLKEAKNEDGKLVFGQGSIAVHIFNVSFLARLIRSGVDLPYHLAHKKVEYIDVDGKKNRPAKANAIKLEQFIFDVFPYTKGIMVMETQRERDFSPIKNAHGEDSLASARRDLSELFAGWLRENRLAVRRGVDGKLLQKIEISPLFAANATDLAGKVTQDMLSGGDILLEP